MSTNGGAFSALGRFAIVLAVPFVLIACSAAATPTADWSEDFDRARERATSDFETNVLDDDVITRAEFEEARSRYFQCIEARGFIVEEIDNGSGVNEFSIAAGMDEQDAVQAAVDDCVIGTTEVIEGLYVSMLQNPDKRNLDDVIAECLVAIGFVDAPFSGPDYKRESGNGNLDAQIMNDEEAVKCALNPSYHRLSELQ